jgi:hypothetical protein
MEMESFIVKLIIFSSEDTMHELELAPKIVYSELGSNFFNRNLGKSSVF